MIGWQAPYTWIMAGMKKKNTSLYTDSTEQRPNVEGNWGYGEAECLSYSYPPPPPNHHQHTILLLGYECNYLSTNKRKLTLHLSLKKGGGGAMIKVLWYFGPQWGV